MKKPKSYEQLAALLRDADRARVVGAGTKDWGIPVAEPDVEISTRKLDAVIEHNAGDLTAIVQAGVPLARLRDQLAEAGQMLAIDPPAGDGATIGGVLATGDSGPLRHRHGGPRDLVLGMTVALSDGTVARSGGKVIKNVAGYDLAKLFTGSHGTLGAILEVAVRLHPLPAAAVTAVGRGAHPDAVARAASDVAHAALEPQCLDVAWAGGEGRVLARMTGAQAAAQAAEAERVLGAAGLDCELVEDDGELWAAQRAAQRSADGVVVRVSGVQTQLAAQMRAAERAGGSLVARAASGLAWIALPAAGAESSIAALRRDLSPSPCVVLDAPRELRQAIDVWGAADGGAVELMRRVKQRFDPAGACSPGLFVGGI